MSDLGLNRVDSGIAPLVVAKNLSASAGRAAIAANRDRSNRLAPRSPSRRRLLLQRVDRAHRAGLLGTRSTLDAALHWRALCLGLATEELCGLMAAGDGDSRWQDATETFLRGLG